MEFHGASFWSGGGTNSPETISITGTGRTPGGYILFDGLQASSVAGIDMYLDQQNETVLCAGNCLFGFRWFPATAYILQSLCARR